jgi:hypothetical protein
MSTTTATAPRLSTPARALAALLIPVGPAAIAVLRYVLPYDTTDSSHAIARKVAADLDTQTLVVWLGFVGVLAIIPSLYWVAQTTRAGAPRLTAAALLLTVPGYTALAFLIVEDFMVWTATKSGLDVGTTTSLLDHLHPASVVAGFFFVLGHVVGTILIGVAMWQSRAVPRWAAIVTIISQPIHFVAAVVVVSHPLDLVGWGLTAIGFAAAALTFWRATDTTLDNT